MTFGGARLPKGFYGHNHWDTSTGNAVAFEEGLGRTQDVLYLTSQVLVPHYSFENWRDKPKLAIFFFTLLRTTISQRAVWESKQH